MLKSLYPTVDWDRVRAVGFDLDGTLYDEAEFIAQVYRPIAAGIARLTDLDPEATYHWLFRRWLEKGSSYKRIFDEALELGGVRAGSKEAAIADCLATFRGFEPQLVLPRRAAAILDTVRGKYRLFIVSDGSHGLQSRKFASLGLQRWFDAQDVCISGCYGAEYAKPGIAMLGKLRGLDGDEVRRNTVFFGDREADAGFAANAGFAFVRVHCMHWVRTP
jgi:FMN phosphatase YigB (HAD superfamily)